MQYSSISQILLICFFLCLIVVHRQLNWKTLVLSWLLSLWKTYALVGSSLQYKKCQAWYHIGLSFVLFNDLTFSLEMWQVLVKYICNNCSLILRLFLTQGKTKSIVFLYFVYSLWKSITANMAVFSLILINVLLLIDGAIQHSYSW